MLILSFKHQTFDVLVGFISFKHAVKLLQTLSKRAFSHHSSLKRLVFPLCGIMRALFSFIVQKFLACIPYASLVISTIISSPDEPSTTSTYHASLAMAVARARYSENDLDS